MATRKQKEIAELLRREISSMVLHELKDPRIGFVTVTRVVLAGDHRSAKVFVTVRGTKEQTADTMEVLAHARGHMQRLIADRLKLRWTPVLNFIEDKELREALRVDRLIEGLKKEQPDAGPASAVGAEESDPEPET